MRDPQQTIRHLETKARDESVTAPERAALNAKIADLRKRHPAPPPAPTTIPLVTLLTTTDFNFSGTVKLKKAQRTATKAYTSSFSFGASEGTADTD